MTDMSIKTNEKEAKRNLKNMLKAENAELNGYYEEFQGCKKSWLWGTIIGILVGAGLSYLFAGFDFDSIFFGTLPFTVVASIWVMAAVFALKFTEDFGLSCVPRGMLSFALSIWDCFAGTYVLVPVAIALMCLVLFAWLFGMGFFVFVLPIETLYYAIRYSVEKGSIKRDLREELSEQSDKGFGMQ